MRASTLQVIDEFRSFVRPTWRPTLSGFCTDLTGISQVCLIYLLSWSPFPETQASPSFRNKSMLHLSSQKFSSLFAHSWSSMVSSTMPLANASSAFAGAVTVHSTYVISSSNSVSSQRCVLSTTFLYGPYTRQTRPPRSPYLNGSQAISSTSA
jgi:hypothetical protein